MTVTSGAARRGLPRPVCNRYVSAGQRADTRSTVTAWVPLSDLRASFDEESTRDHTLQYLKLEIKQSRVIK
ncbi:hypothetical protein J6590_001854 [Homalodisca vitripennis]|nr:hypothetical protein J6590_001854 [Homalodisca vitripennis]